MTRAVYTFFDKKSHQIAEKIEFELLENRGSQAWQYAVMLNSSARICFKKDSITFSTSLPADIDHRFEKLINTIHVLDYTDFTWQYDIPKSFAELSQEFLNCLHRHFTNSCYQIWDHRSTNFENFKINDSLQKLNDIIHDIEKYVPTEMKSKYALKGKEICLRSHGTELGYDLFPFRQYHSFEPADLILDGYILGKTLLESFACEDVPSAWDTNGHFKTNGGATVVLDNSRSSIYQSPDYDAWLVKHGVDKHTKLADFPLGNFVSGHRTKLESLENCLQKFFVELHIQQ